MRDNLPKKIHKNECGVINLDSSNGNGTHWVCYYKKGNIQYYDSFGIEPPQELLNYFGNNVSIVYNYNQDQSFDQVICGHLCILFLLRCYKKYGE